MTYSDFLLGKSVSDAPTGLTFDAPLSDRLFDFQRDIVSWSLRRGRAAIFADCGMGKTPMQLEWAKHVPGPVVIAAPLAVAQQTVREGDKFGIPCRYARADDGGEGIQVTNYEMLPHFDAGRFAGIVLDESSILKSHTGKFRSYVIEQWGAVPFRLCATATPAPNDFMELGNHAEFLGVMSRAEMLAMFFVHDGGETQKWRIKGHAESDFWRWICSWAVMLRKPSDLGYEDGDFRLPRLNMFSHVVESDASSDGFLFELPASSLLERRQSRKSSLSRRVECAASLANGNDEQWLVWCDLNSESAALTSAIRGAIEVKGSDSNEHKESALTDFAEGRLRVLVSKPSIAGFGMNFQRCHNMAFTGLSDSYEQFYQAVRRCWRFGQSREVNCHVVTSSAEGAVVANIQRKEADAQRMGAFMVEHMADLSANDIHGAARSRTNYAANKRMEVPSFI